MNDQDLNNGENAQDEEVKRPFPRKIIIGGILICLGIFLILRKVKIIDDWDLIQYLPVTLIALGIVRVWNRGLFNILAQAMIIGGILMHIAFMGLQAAKDYWLPALTIWIGTLVLIKGVIVFIRPEDADGNKITGYSRFRWPRPGDTSADTDKLDDSIEAQPKVGEFEITEGENRNE